MTETIRGNKKAAERTLRDRLIALDNGTHTAKTRETVGAFLDRWLATYVATNTAPSTQRASQRQRTLLSCNTPHRRVPEASIADLVKGALAPLESGVSQRSVTTVQRTVVAADRKGGADRSGG